MVKKPLIILTKEQKEARKQDMVALYKSGMTLQDIGNKYGMTRERVRQIIVKEGVTSKDGGKTVQKIAKQKNENLLRAHQKQERTMKREAHHKKWVEKNLENAIHEIEQAGLPHYREHIVCNSYIRIRLVRWHQHQEKYMNYIDWATVWRASGYFSMASGPEKGWCMTRIDHNAPWSVENAKIVRSGSWLTGRPRKRRHP